MKNNSLTILAVTAMLGMSAVTVVSIGNKFEKFHEVKADSEVSYVTRSWNSESNTVVETPSTCNTYTVVDNSTDEWTNGFYVVGADVTIAKRVTVTGTVNLILCDGATLTASKGIFVSKTNTLNIFGQSSDTGAIIATGDYQNAGIGGNIAYSGYEDLFDAGTITIHGGTVTANGGNLGAGIGGGQSAYGGTVTVYGGTVTANGGYDGSGIGSGPFESVGNNVNIYGGTVTANGGEYGSGIGGSYEGNAGTITIHGGTVTANGGNLGVGIGKGSEGSSDGTLSITNSSLVLLGNDTKNPSYPADVLENTTTRYRYMAVILPHEHSWSYSADGATITASCSNANCPVAEGLTLELQAPTSLTYSGTAKAATFKAGYNTEVFPSPTIKYYQGTTEVSSCVNAGTYSAKVTFDTATAELEFTIAKATPTPAAVTDKNAVYGQSLSDITLPEGWTWNNPSDKVGNAGTNQHKATFTPTDTANYNTLEQNVNVIVAKADPEYTVPTGLTALVNKTLSTVTLPNGWTWDDPTQSVGSEAGDKVFKGTFTPADTNNYNTVEHVDITVKVSKHEHNWSYTVNGATITASCSNAECPIAEGLTLTLEAPKGDLHYDGNAKVATLKTGYSEEAFPNATIKYFKNNAEVNQCVNVGKYTAKVTFGNAVAMVEFEILGKTIVDPDTSAVSIEIDDAVVPENVELRVEVRTDVAEKDIAEDYAKIKEKLESNEQISKVYDVKLIQTVGGIEKEIQPSDIKPGLKITLKMAIPEGMDLDNVRILHIHSVDDMEFISDYVIDGNDLVLEIDRLSQFAFITKVNAPSGGNNGSVPGIIALILDILLILVIGLYIILRLKPFKLPNKIDEFSVKITSKEVLLTFIALLVLFANFILDLVFLIVYQNPFTIVAFILALLLLGCITFWYIRTRMKGEMTPVEEKVFSKIKKKDLKESSEDNKE